MHQGPVQVVVGREDLAQSETRPPGHGLGQGFGQACEEVVHLGGLVVAHQEGRHALAHQLAARAEQEPATLVLGGQAGGRLVQGLGTAGRAGDAAQGHQDVGLQLGLHQGQARQVVGAELGRAGGQVVLLRPQVQ